MICCVDLLEIEFSWIRKAKGAHGTNETDMMMMFTSPKLRSEYPVCRREKSKNLNNTRINAERSERRTKWVSFLFKTNFQIKASFWGVWVCAIDHSLNWQQEDCEKFANFFFFSTTSVKLFHTSLKNTMWLKRVNSRFRHW